MVRGFSAALLALCLGTTALADIGSGFNRYSVRVDDYTFQVRTYRPDCRDPDILFMHHGSSRNSNDYVAYPQELADRECFVVVAPLFNSTDFSNTEYQRANLSGNANRPERWTTRYVPGLIAWAKRELGGDPDVIVSGHSAGGQFASRVAMDWPEGADLVVPMNPSTWFRATLDERWPYGFGGAPNAEKRLREYLARPIVVYLGGADTSRDGNLASDAAAERQGRNRLERGINTFNEAKREAERRGWAFNWRLVIADGVGHSGNGMVDHPAARDAFTVPATRPDPEPEVRPQPEPDCTSGRVGAYDVTLCPTS